MKFAAYGALTLVGGLLVSGVVLVIADLASPGMITKFLAPILVLSLGISAWMKRRNRQARHAAENADRIIRRLEAVPPQTGLPSARVIKLVQMGLNADAVRLHRQEAGSDAHQASAVVEQIGNEIRKGH